MECPGLAGLWRQCPAPLDGLQPFERQLVLAVAVPLAIVLAVLGLALITLLVSHLTDGVSLGVRRRTTDPRASRADRLEMARRHLLRSAPAASARSRSVRRGIVVGGSPTGSGWPGTVAPTAPPAAMAWRPADDGPAAGGVPGPERSREAAVGAAAAVARRMTGAAARLEAAAMDTATAGAALARPAVASASRQAAVALSLARPAVASASARLVAALADAPGPRVRAAARTRLVAPVGRRRLRAGMTALRAGAERATARATAASVSRPWLLPSVPASLHRAALVLASPEVREAVSAASVDGGIAPATAVPATAAGVGAARTEAAAPSTGIAADKAPPCAHDVSGRPRRAVPTDGRGATSPRRRPAGRDRSASGSRRLRAPSAPTQDGRQHAAAAASAIASTSARPTSTAGRPRRQGRAEPTDRRRTPTQG